MTDNTTLTGLLVLATLTVFVVAVATAAIVDMLAGEKARPHRDRTGDQARDPEQGPPLVQR